MIINIRGTNGSGKTWVVKQLMSRYEAAPIIGTDLVRNRDFIEGYQLDCAARIVGRYDRPSGGCDAVKTQDETRSLVEKYSQHGSVIFEGLLVSGIYGRWADFARSTPDYRWVFLNTTLEACIENVKNRRVLAGKDPHFDTKALKAKFRSVESICLKVMKDFPKAVVYVSSETALGYIEEWLG